MNYEPNVYFIILAIVTAIIVFIGSWLCRGKEKQKVFTLERGECDTCGQHSILHKGLCSICRKTYKPEDR
jgi:hypothetical protein